jgi:hypothetical protein
MDRRDVGWGDIDWIDLAQDGGQWRALKNKVMNLPNKCWEILEWLSDWHFS